MDSPSTSFGAKTHVVVDPESRAFATIVYSAYVAIVPLRTNRSTASMLRDGQAEDEAKVQLNRILEDSENSDSDDEDSEEDEEEDDDVKMKVESDSDEEAGTATLTEQNDAPPKRRRVEGGGSDGEDSEASMEKNQKPIKAKKESTTTTPTVALAATTLTNAGNAEHKQLRVRGRILKSSSKRTRECGGNHPLFYAPHILPLSRFGIPEHNVLDCKFLYGETRPTLAFLYSSPLRSWTPRVHVRRYTTSICAISIVPENPLAPARVWGAANLPHDSLYLIPVPKPPAASAFSPSLVPTKFSPATLNQERGVLLVASNAVLHVTPTPRHRYTMAVNGYARTSCNATRSNPLHDYNGKVVSAQEGTVLTYDETNEGMASETVALSLDSSRWVWITDDVILGTLSRGELFQIDLSEPLQGKGLVMHGRLLGTVSANAVTCGSNVVECKFGAFNNTASGLLFWGSRCADGVWIRWSATRAESAAHSMIRVNAQNSVDQTKGEDEDLYGYFPNTSLPSGEPIFATTDVQYEIVGTMTVTGPITDMDFAESLPASPFVDADNYDEEDRLILEFAEKNAKECIAQGRYSQAATTKSKAQNLVAERRKSRATQAVPRDVDLVSCGPKSRLGGSCYLFQHGYRANLHREISVAECGNLFSFELNGTTHLLASESARTRMFSFQHDSGELAEIGEGGMFYAAQDPTLFAFSHVESDSAVQVFPETIRHVGKGGLKTSVTPLYETNTPKHLLTQCFAERDVLGLLFSDGLHRFFQTTKSGLHEIFPFPKDDAPKFACCSLFYDSAIRAICLGAVRAGTADPPALVHDTGTITTTELIAGRFETYEFVGAIFKRRFASTLPLCLANQGLNAVKEFVSDAMPAAAAHPRATTKEEEIEAQFRRGVCTNSRVVDLVVGEFGTGPMDKTVTVVAALADGDLVAYTRIGLGDTWTDMWCKAPNFVITRGLRGHGAHRPRRFAQPAGQFGRAFKAQLLVKFTNLGGSTSGAFFAGHRPSFVFCQRGKVSVTPLASTAASALPTPLFAATSGLASQLAFAGGNAANGEDEGSRTKLVPGPADAYKARGAVHAFCPLHVPGVPHGFVYALRAPESIRINTALKATAIRFCGPQLPEPTHDLARSSMDFDPLGVVAIKRHVPDWHANRLLFLALASRGSEEELPLGLHAPTFAMVTGKDQMVPATSVPLEIQTYHGEPVPIHPESEPDVRLGGAPDIIMATQGLHLFRSPNFKTPCSSFELKQDERVISMCTANVDVPSETDERLNLGGRAMLPGLPPSPKVQHSGLLVIGTGSVEQKGEESYANGRILVFKIEHGESGVSPSHDGRGVGRPDTKPQLKMLANVDLRGPISALCNLDGKILAATGNVPSQLKLLELSRRNDGGLVPVGFYDSTTLVVTMNVIKDQYVLLGDMNKALTLLRWRNRQFVALGKTIEPVRVFSTEFSVDTNRLTLCAADDSANLRLWQFDPDSPNLLLRAQMNIGERVGKMRAKRMTNLPPKISSNESGGASGGGMSIAQQAEILAQVNAVKWNVICGTYGGGLGSLVPLDEKTYRKLEQLQTHLISLATLVPRNAGLHPLNASFPRNIPPPNNTSCKSILDGRLLWRFIDLERIAQIRVAKAMGSNVDAVLEMLLEIDLMGVW